MPPRTPPRHVPASHNGAHRQITSVGDLSLEELMNLVSENNEEKMSPAALKQARLLIELGELGGAQAGEDNIVHEGTRFVIPVGTTKRQAAKALTDAAAAEEKIHAFSRTFRYRPWDGAWAFDQVVRKHFGMMIGRSTFDFFGNEHPPIKMTINIGPEQTIQVPWGACAIPLMPGATITLGSVNDREWGPLFQISAEAPGKYARQLEGVFNLVQRELETNSMYRGKAIDGKTEANFLDLSSVDWEAVIYSDETTEQLNANIWSILDHTQAQIDNGLPLKRANLLEGPFGTGKTLAAFLTAECATRNQWSFIYCRPGDNLHYVMQTARLYQPAVVFMEDVELVASPEVGQDAVHQVLDLFDGITAKGTKIMMILTTNHVDKITKAMMRPGRLDAVIHIGELDPNGMRRLVLATTPRDALDTDNIDWDRVWESMRVQLPASQEFPQGRYIGFLPAFVTETVRRAMRYNIARRGGTLGQLTTDDLVASAKGLQPQLSIMEEAAEPLPVQALITGMAHLVDDRIRGNVREDLLTPEASPIIAAR